MIESSISGKTGIEMADPVKPKSISPKKIVIGESPRFSSGEVPIMKTARRRRTKAMKITPLRPMSVE